MTRYKKRPLNETAMFIRPLLGFPKILATVAVSKLKDFADAIGFDYTGRCANDLLDLYCGTASLDDLYFRRVSRMERLRQANFPAPVPVADLAPVLQLPYYPEKPPTTVYNGVCGQNGATPIEGVDPPANAIVGGFSTVAGNGKANGKAKKAAKMADEPLYAKKGKRYSLAKDGQEGPLYRKVKIGKVFRYLPA
jgi:hypothetical protein